MYQPITLFIGLRYIRGCATDPFRRFISWFSTISIALGLLALITILSIMNGFERELKNGILNLIPQALIISNKGSLNPQQYPISEIKLQNIRRIEPLTTSDVVLQSSSNIAVGIMLGIQPNEVDPLTPWLVDVQQQELQPGQYNVILGKQLAIRLNVKRGNQLRLIVPSAGQITPIGYLPSQRLFNVIGTFSTNSEVDGYQMLVNLQDASRLMRYPVSNITGWRLWLDNPLDVDRVSKQKIPKELVWKDWRARKGDFFQAMRMEKNIMSLLLSLIIILAISSIIAFISLLTMDKQGEVAILQTQGMTRYQIIFIFMIQGASYSIIGILLGLLLVSQLNNFMSLISIFFNSVATLPINISLWQVVIISLTVIIITSLSTIYPSCIAASVQPTEALRHE